MRYVLVFTPHNYTLVVIQTTIAAIYMHSILFVEENQKRDLNMCEIEALVTEVT